MVTALTSSFCRYAPAMSFRGAYWQVRAASSRLLKTGFGRLARLSRRTGPHLSLPDACTHTGSHVLCGRPPSPTFESRTSPLRRSPRWLRDTVIPQDRRDTVTHSLCHQGGRSGFNASHAVLKQRRPQRSRPSTPASSPSQASVNVAASQSFCTDNTLFFCNEKQTDGPGARPREGRL